MEKITEKQYLYAIDIIKNYKKQIESEVDLLNDKKHTIQFVLDNYEPISRRLCTLLLIYPGCKLDNIDYSNRFELYKIYRETHFIQDVKIKELLKMRQCGNKSIIEFNAILEDLNNTTSPNPLNSHQH